jgi:hypothetical protein
MAELVKLSNTQHQTLCVRPECNLELAATQQIMKLRVTELSKAVTNFPVFFTKDQNHGGWVLSALTSFELGQNLFVDDDIWQGTYQPNSMLTHPLYLMKSDEGQNNYAIGILDKSPAFSKEQGEALFDANGNASSYLNRVTKLLETEVRGDIQTSQFSQKLLELGLLKAIDLQILYQDDSAQTLAGLHTIDEDKLQSLSAEQLAELSRLGYLIPAHAMLISIYQLNLLFRKNNECKRCNTVKSLKIEVAKDRVAA